MNRNDRLPALRMGLTATALALVLGAGATAQQYVSASAGFNFQSDSSNEGSFTSDFTTGEGVVVPAGTVLASGTPLGWNTEFDTSGFVSAAYGWRLDNGFRLEAEIGYSSSDVDTHTDVTAGGNPIGAADAAVLITGSPELGVTVADLVADGRGQLRNTSFMINAYYDFDLEGPLGAYAGAGIGASDVKVRYNPSDTAIINDSETVFAYQAMAGVSYDVSDTFQLFGGYRYRATQNVDFDVTLFPATLDIENRSNILEVGARVYF
ncbi:MAG: outer membrane porin [Oceanicaulis sp. HLUCCA04]|nr:MAG: outer membrane porin [Oceanicaulis sp. HLUCCA04]